VDRQKKEGGYELMLEPNVYYTFRTLDLGLFIIVNKNLAQGWGSSLCLTHSTYCNKLFHSARPLRIENPGALYHVMNRGRRGENIFVDSGQR
jgi:hypothetical protein